VISNIQTGRDVNILLPPVHQQKMLQSYMKRWQLIHTLDKKLNLRRMLLMAIFRDLERIVLWCVDACTTKSVILKPLHDHDMHMALIFSFVYM
jgi:hypothetical protein